MRHIVGLVLGLGLGCTSGEAPNVTRDQAPIVSDSNRREDPTPPAPTPPPIVTPERASPSARPVGDHAPTIEFVTEKSSSTYAAWVAYPKLTFRSPNLSLRVNDRIARFVAAHRQSFNRYLATDYVDEHAFYVFSCEVAYASENSLSLGCDSYTFNGGAHGTKGYSTLNLVLPSLRELSSGDLLRADAAAQRQLIALCDASLAERARRDPELEEVRSLQDELGHGHEPTFDAFTLDERGLTFYFKDQLAHVNADVVVPSVSWKDLEPLLLAETPTGLPRGGASGAKAKPSIDPWCARGGDC